MSWYTNTTEPVSVRILADAVEDVVLFCTRGEETGNTTETRIPLEAAKDVIADLQRTVARLEQGRRRR